MLEKFFRFQLFRTCKFSHLFEILKWRDLRPAWFWVAQFCEGVIIYHVCLFLLQDLESRDFVSVVILSSRDYGSRDYVSGVIMYRMSDHCCREVSTHVMSYPGWYCRRNSFCDMARFCTAWFCTAWSFHAVLDEHASYIETKMRCSLFFFNNYLDHRWKIW